MRIIRKSACPVMPWKNGGGATMEIMRSPAEGEAFDWRVSVADVTSNGPFSAFPGYDRHIMVIKGDGGMALRQPSGDEDPAVLHPMRAHSFAGELPVYGLLLDGPVQDFNLIVHRGEYSGSLSCGTLTQGHYFAGELHKHTLHHVAYGTIEHERETLAAGDSLYLPPGGKAKLNGLGVLIIAAIERL